MTEFQAILGLRQLERFDRELVKRKRLATHYLNQLSGYFGLDLPQTDEGCSWQTFMVVLNQNLSRDKVIKHLASLGIQANLSAQAINNIAYYRAKYVWNAKTCPEASRLYQHGIALPLHGKLTPRDIRFVADSLKSLLAGHFAL